MGVTRTLEQIPVVGDSLIDRSAKSKSSIKQLVVPGMFFEDMGITYLGPVPGHDVSMLCRAFKRRKKVEGPGIDPCIDNKMERAMSRLK